MQEHKNGDSFTRGQFMWLDQVLADQSLPMGVFQVAYVIAKHVNRGTGDAWLGTRRLSEKAGVSRPFAIKAMRLLEAAGYLAVENGTGRGNTNRYRMIGNGSPDEQETVHAVNHLDEINGQRGYTNGQRQNINGQRQNEKGKPGYPDSLNNTLKEPLKEPLTAAQPAKPASLSESDHPSKADLFEQQERPAKEGKEEQQERAPQGSAPPPRENATVVPPPDTAAGCSVSGQRKSKAKPPVDDGAFELFWNAYPRHVAKGGARKAYAAALKKTSAADILAGAQRYATERASQDPKYTKYPSTWLGQECWLDEPGPARVIDQDGGNPVTPHQANGGRMNGHPRPIGKTDEWMLRARQHVLDGRRAREGGVS
jgi:hypothetical protein